MSSLIGLVLAGGAGRRLGTSKGDYTWRGRPLAERAAEALWPLCGEVLISVQPGGVNPAPRFTAVEDEPPAGRGPLAGIAGAFARTGAADLLVLACDYPRVETDFARAVVAAARPGDALVLPVDRAGRDHPLVALWRRSTEPAVRQALDHGCFKVGAVMADLDVRRLHPADLPDFDLDRLLVNVNTPGDLAGLTEG